MKKILGFVAVTAVMFLSNSVFAEDLIFEVGGTKYEAAKQDLYGFYTWIDAKAGCARLMTEEFNDGWVLPSKEEQKAMYDQNEQLKGVVVFNNGAYWSSTEVDEDNASGQNLITGEPSEGRKSFGARVRCIRII